MKKNELDAVTVSLERVRHIVKTLDKLPNDTDISLEYILTALFPTVWTNIQKTMKDCYTKGYIAGFNEKK